MHIEIVEIVSKCPRLYKCVLFNITLDILCLYTNCVCEMNFRYLNVTKSEQLLLILVGISIVHILFTPGFIYFLFIFFDLVLHL